MSTASKPPALPPAFLYLNDLPALRDKLARAERDGSLMGRVWAGVRRRAQTAPEQFPWFVPFVAMITQSPSDLAAAKKAIQNYVATFEAQQFGMGLQFHFWCFAFPHARWALYFSWLDQLGAWDEPQRSHLREELISWQFINFFYGMRTKPEPECVDNQTMSLCFSNAIVGQLFGTGPNASPTAARMGRDGMRRLPSMLGGFPPSGYSGEGSTYMDHVVGPSVPFVVELLETAHGQSGGEWFNRTLAPNGGSAASIVKMIAREWTPSGLTLPWDHYGYALPTRSCIAYGAHRTGDPLYLNLLENHACWGSDVSIGWGFDDLIWSLIWWPENKNRKGSASVYQSWAEPTVGAAIVSDDASLYAMQMWDESAPLFPGRAQVNPNNLIFVAHGSPLTIDGVAKNCEAFNYPDTWISRTNMEFVARKDNFGSGCAGSHSVLLVDGWESMRAMSQYEQATLVKFDAKEKSVIADVTPMYHEKWADTRRIRRRTRLCHERFWLIEDLASFGAPHEVTARWYLRPQQIPAKRGIAIETAEGVQLHLLPLLGPDAPTVTPIKGYPDRLDGLSLRADFKQSGSTNRWLWLAWPQLMRRELQDVSTGWQAIADIKEDIGSVQANEACLASRNLLPLTMPAFMAADLPVTRRWWYRKEITAPTGTAWLRLPRLLWNAALWIDGVEIDLTEHLMRMELMEFDVKLPPKSAGQKIEILLRVDCGASQYGKGDHQGSAFWGRPIVLVPEENSQEIQSASYCENIVTICAQGREWKIPHTLLTTE